MHTRTRRQREVLEFIANFIDRHGNEPSYQQIANHFGLRSKGGIAKHIQALEAQKLLVRNRENGSFRISLPARENSAEKIVFIEWLEVPHDTLFDGELNKEPLIVPRAMIGTIATESLRVFRVRNDLMIERSILPGDIAIIELKRFVRDGEVVVAIVDRKRVVMKRFFRAGANIELRPANRRSETIVLSADKIEIKGVYRGLIRPLY